MKKLLLSLLVGLCSATHLSSQLLSNFNSTIKPINTTADTKLGNNFGKAIAYENDIVVVGAPDVDSSLGLSTGATYIYQIDQINKTWEFKQKLTSPSAGPGTQMGMAVAIHGNYIASSSFDGKVFIYKKNATTGIWELFQTIVASAGSFGFGKTLYFDFDKLVITAPTASKQVNTTTINNVGKVFIYEINPSNGTWEEKHTFEPEIYSAGANNNFGRSVSLNANFLFIGSDIRDNMRNKANAGRLFIYKKKMV